MIELVHPFEDGEFHGLCMTPCRSCRRRCRRMGSIPACQAFGVANRHVLNAAIAMIRRCKISLRLAQYLIGLAQFAVLALQGLHPFRHLGGDARGSTSLNIRLLHPVHQRVGRTADLPGNRRRGRPPGWVFPLMVQHHPCRPGPNLRAELARRLARHGSSLLGSWSLRETRRGSVRRAIAEILSPC